VHRQEPVLGLDPRGKAHKPYEFGRNYLKGRHGDHANAVLTATGHNFRLVLRWLRELLNKLIEALITAISPVSALRTAS